MSDEQKHREVVKVDDLDEKQKEVEILGKKGIVGIDSQKGVNRLGGSPAGNSGVTRLTGRKNV